MLIEVVGYKGVVGGATYRWFEKMKPRGARLIGRDLDDLMPVSTDISFICLPEAVAESNCLLVSSYSGLAVIRSTVPPGTCKGIMDNYGYHVCHNPEFLRAATATKDIFNPPFILIGACCSDHGNMLAELYKPAHVDIIVTTPGVSELAKIVLNNYLACQISFWNEIDQIADRCNVSGHELGAIVSRDSRVSEYGARYHHKFGGACLPKELDQILEFTREIGLDTPMLNAILKVNRRMGE